MQEIESFFCFLENVVWPFSMSWLMECGGVKVRQFDSRLKKNTCLSLGPLPCLGWSNGSWQTQVSITSTVQTAYALQARDAPSHSQSLNNQLGASAEGGLAKLD